VKGAETRGTAAAADGGDDDAAAAVSSVRAVAASTRCSRETTRGAPSPPLDPGGLMVNNKNIIIIQAEKRGHSLAQEARLCTSKSVVSSSLGENESQRVWCVS